MKHFLSVLWLIATFFLSQAVNAQGIYDYEVSSSVETYSSIATTGTQLSFSSTDDGYATFVSPMRIIFGTDTLPSGSSVALSANGFIYLGASSTSGTTCATSGTYRAINPLLNVDAHLGRYSGVSAAFWKHDTQNQCLVLEYRALGSYSSPYGYYSYQVKLYENGNIDIHYDSTNFGGTARVLRVFLRNGPRSQMLYVSGTWTAPSTQTVAAQMSALPARGTCLHFSIPTCRGVANLGAVSLSRDSVQISWNTVSGESEWIFSDGNSVEAVFDSIIYIDTVRPNTTYTYTVRSICSGNDTSNARILTFTTPCSPMQLPFYYGFEDWPTGTSANAPSCWGKGSTDGSTLYPYVSSTYAYSGTRSMYLYEYVATRGSYFVCPPVNVGSLDSCSVSFYLYNSSASYPNCKILVGTIGMASNPNSFEPYDTINVPLYGSGWNEYEVDFANYHGRSKQVAFFVPQQSTWSGASYCYTYLDDVYIDYTPTCKRPIRVEAGDILSDSILLTWFDTTNTFWTIVYGPAGFDINDHDDPNVLWTSSSDTSIWIDGLNPNTRYDFYVMSNCGFSDTSRARLATFRTACGLSRLPYFEDFDNITTSVSAATGVSPFCWNLAHWDASTSMTATYMPQLYYNASYATSGSYSLRLYYRCLYALPTFDVDSLNDVIVAFDVYASSTTYQLGIGVMTDQGADTTYTELQRVVYPSSGKHHYEISLSQAPANFKTIAFRNYYSTSGTTNYSYHYIDNVEVWVERCPRVTNVSQVSVGTDSILLTWRPGGYETNWVVYCNGQDYAVQDTFLYITGLRTGVTYTCDVHAVCPSDTSYRRRISFTPGVYPMQLIGSDTIRACNTIITDDGGPASNYGHGANSILVVYPLDANHGLNIQGVVTNMEQCCDYIQVYEGAGTNGNMLYSSQGSSSGNFGPFFTEDDPFTILFHSDGSVSYEGFSIQTSCSVLPACRRTASFSLDSLSFDAASFSWHDINASQWLIEYGPSGFTHLDPNDTTIRWASFSDTTGIIGNLLPNTAYDFYLMALCSDTSNPRKITLRTPCTPITRPSLPYNYGFEDATSNNSSGTINSCWKKYVSGSTTAYPYPTATVHTGSHALYFYGLSTIRCYAVMPLFEASLDSLMVSWWMKPSSTSSSYVGIIKVGVMVDPDDFSTFTPVGSFSCTGNSTWTQYEAYFAGYHGSGRFIAFVDDYSSSTNSLYLDDVTVDWAPSCIPPQNFRVASNTASSITLEWDNITATTDWIISYDSITNATAAGGVKIPVSGATTYTVNGLTSGTNYTFFIRAVCSSSDSSRWIGPLSAMPGVWNMRINMIDTLRMCGGVIYDDGGVNGQYGNSQNSYIILYPDAPQQAISITGTSHTESTFDYLRIYDGVGTNGTELWNDYGTTALQSFGPLESSTGPLTIYFHSDGSVTYAGFAINVSCVSNTCPRVGDLRVDSVYGSTFRLDWTERGTASSWQVEYGVHDDNGTVYYSYFTSSHPFNIHDLDNMSIYDIRVRPICSPGDTGSWSQIVYSTPICPSPSVAYTVHDSMTTSTTTYFPGYSYYRYSFTQVILPAAKMAEIGSAPIQALGFIPTSTNNTDYYHNITIYLANTSATDLATSFIQDSTLEQVFSGNFEYTVANEEYAVPFDTNWFWDGHSNVLVTILRNDGNYHSPYDQFKAYNDTATLARYIYNDNSAYSFGSVSGGTATSIVPYYRLISCRPACSRPAQVTATDIDYQGATIVWTGTGSNYEISILPPGYTSWLPETMVTDLYSYTFSMLQPVTTYQFRVRQVCNLGSEDETRSDWTYGFFTTDSLPCFPPYDLRLVEADYTGATLAWELGSAEDLWMVHVWNTSVDRIYFLDSNPGHIDELAANTRYYATVTALCGGGYRISDDSDPIAFTTRACDVPHDIQVSNVRGVSADISWEGIANRYEIQYGPTGFPNGTGTRIFVNGHNYTLHDLQPGETYDVVLRAMCEVSVSSNYSQTVTFHTRTAIDDVEQSQISLYPNPASTSTTLDLSNLSGDWQFSLVDVNGRLLQSKTLSTSSSSSFEIDLSGLSAGTYFVRLKGLNANFIRKLIIK